MKCSEEVASALKARRSHNQISLNSNNTVELISFTMLDEEVKGEIERIYLHTS
jgi:hypothetical protein